MNEQEFKIFVGTAQAAYGSPNVMKDEPARRVWWKMIKDLPGDVAFAALQKHICTNKFPPTIADIRSGCTAVAMGEQKDWSEGWNKALRLVGKYGYMREAEALAELRAFDPIAAKALEMLGWKQLCESPADDVTFRANFRQVYQTAQKRSEERAQLPANVAAMLESATQSLQLGSGE